MKPLSQDRLWCLRVFKDGGWTIGRGDWNSVKKWDGHKAALVKSGYLENDQEYPTMYRITDAGHAALKEQGE